MQSTQEFKNSIAKEIQKYQTKQNGFKEYYISMKELSLWLNSKVTK